MGGLIARRRSPTLLHVAPTVPLRLMVESHHRNILPRVDDFEGAVEEVRAKYYTWPCPLRPRCQSCWQTLRRGGIEGKRTSS